MRISDPAALTSGLVWVLLTYADGSEFCFQTTLNSELLHQYGVVLDEGMLVRLDKKYLENGEFVYRQFSFRNAKVSLWSEETYTDETSSALRKFM